jgi:hypothetical protein
MFRTGDVYELAEADRIDSDPLAMHLYENFAIPTAKECGEIDVHTAMHGVTVAQLCGVWLNLDAHIASLVSRTISGGYQERYQEAKSSRKSWQTIRGYDPQRTLTLSVLRPKKMT